MTSGCLVSADPLCGITGHQWKIILPKRHLSKPFTRTLSVPPSLRRGVHVGDLDVRHQAFPGSEEQRRDWQDRERRAIGHASSVPAHPLQFDDQMLVI